MWSMVVEADNSYKIVHRDKSRGMRVDTDNSCKIVRKDKPR